MTGPGESQGDPVQRAKQAIRKQILDARAALTPSQRSDLSALVTARLLDTPEVLRAGCVLAYLSFGNELATAAFVSRLRERNVSVVLPRVDRDAHRLRLYRVPDIASDTVPGVWGIREPDPERCAAADIGELDLIVVPGVAFTPAGERLGYGGGYYDELLSRSATLPPLIAPAFDLQVVSALPTTPRDHRVDLVVTQSVLYRS